MYRDRVLHHLQKLVEIYPESANQDAVLEALQYCDEVLRSTGTFRDAKFHKIDEFNSLTASTQGNKKSKLLLQAHIDVVSAQSKPSCTVNTDEDCLKGRGVYDMLFAIATYLAFVEQNRDQLDKLDIGIMITGDEELGGFNGVGYLVQKGYLADVCILPDAGEGFGDLSISAKGAYNFDLVANGRSHHGSRPWEGDGAANKLILMIHELMDSFDDSNQHNSTLTVTRFDGGGSINKGPSEAIAHLDIRFKDAEDYLRIRNEVERICKHYGGQTKNMLEADNTSINIEDHYIQSFIKLYRKHNKKPITYSNAHGGSDARFFVNKGVPTIMLRPNGSGAHSDDECVEINSLYKFYELIEEFVLKTAKISTKESD